MYAIAGVTGRVGSVVAQSLLSSGAKVRVLVRDEAKAEPWRGRGAEVVIGALDDATAVRHLLTGARGFFTLLPEDPFVPDLRMHRRRMAGVIAGAVEESGVSHVVLLSAIAAVLPEGNGPAAELHHAENALRGTPATLTALRATSFQENVLMALEPARREGIYPSFFPSADIPMPAVATRDVGRFAATCLLEPPSRSEIVDVAGPAYSARQMADALGVALGKTLRVVDIPAAAHTDVLTRAGLPAAFAASVAELYACFASGRIAPRGDRMLAGGTTLAETLAGLVSR